MRLRLLSIIYLLLGLPLAAQGPEKQNGVATADVSDNSDDDSDHDTTVRVSVRPSSLGNVSFTFYGSSGIFLDLLPKVLNCSWVETERNDYRVEGTCRGWLQQSLDPSSGRLRLAPLVAALERRGARPVELNLLSGPKLEAQSGWQVRGKKSRYSSYLSFTSSSEASLPGDLVIPLNKPPNLAVPILLVLSVPLLLAYVVRLRATEASADRKMNWIVWMNWILLAIWLYWISVVNPTELADFLLLLAPLGKLVTLTLGSLIYSVPPLFSMSACLIAMAPLLSSSKESFKLVLRQHLVGQARIQVPLGIFLVGIGEGTGSAFTPTLSIVAAYLVYRGLAWLHWSMSYSQITPLESGELFERASALAQKAGVKIARLGMLRTRVPEQVNAFAMSGNTIVLTESLIRGLTPREVNAVIAHELGHHKAGHVRVNVSNILFWVFLLVAGPCIGWMESHFHLPAWLLTLPILPLGFIMLQGLLSQRRELDADSRATQITGDPEGKIAALGRLARVSRMPVEARGIMESIQSHPSMEKRVLALARRHNIDDTRALAILRDPDVAYTDPIANLATGLDRPALVREPDVKEPVFNLRERAVYLEQTHWLHLLAPLIAAFLIGLVIDKFVPEAWYFLYRKIILLAFLLGPAVMLGLEQVGHVFLGTLFITRLQRKIAVRLMPQPGSVFVGIHPCTGVRFTEGFPEWDFGYVTLEGDWFVYRGEKARFAVPRQAIVATKVVKGPVRWLREHRVEVSFPGGVLTLNQDFAHPSQRAAIRTESWIRSWISAGAAAQPSDPAPERPPLLPRVPGATFGRWAPLWFVAKTTLKIWLVAPLLYFTGSSYSAIGVVLVAFGAPLAVFLSALPGVIWPIRQMDAKEQPQQAPEPEAVF
jgi:Zn-dependent protease with chaperone function